MPFDSRAEGGWSGIHLGLTNSLRFQHAKRPPTRGQRALAFSRDDLDLGQVIEQTRLERLQRALLLAKEIGLGLALSLPLQRVAVERVIRNILTSCREQSNA